MKESSKSSDKKKKKSHKSDKKSRKLERKAKKEKRKREKALKKRLKDEKKLALEKSIVKTKSEKSIISNSNVIEPEVEYCGPSIGEHFKCCCCFLPSFRFIQQLQNLIIFRSHESSKMPRNQRTMGTSTKSNKTCCRSRHWTSAVSQNLDNVSIPHKKYCDFSFSETDW